METINYDRCRRKKKGNKFMLYFSTLSMVASVGVIAYFIINEPTPTVVGSDPTKIVEQQAAQKLEEESKKQLLVSVEVKNEKDTSGKRVVANIDFPIVSIDKNASSNLNSEIENNIRTTFVTLKNQMEGNVNSSYEFTSLFKNYENMIGEHQVLSIIVTDKMMDTVAKNTTSLKSTTYNVNVKTMEKVASYDVALELYGNDYKNYVSNIVTSYLIDKSVKTSNDASYVYTGLENYYVDSGEMHIVLNTTDVGTDKFGVIDIKIPKKS